MPIHKCTKKELDEVWSNHLDNKPNKEKYIDYGTDTPYAFVITQSDGLRHAYMPHNFPLDYLLHEVGHMQQPHDDNTTYRQILYEELDASIFAFKILNKPMKPFHIAQAIHQLTSDGFKISPTFMIAMNYLKSKGIEVPQNVKGIVWQSLKYLQKSNDKSIEELCFEYSKYNRLFGKQ